MFTQVLELIVGLEPTACALRMRCSTNWATVAIIDLRILLISQNAFILYINSSGFASVIWKIFSFYRFLFLLQQITEFVKLKAQRFFLVAVAWKNELSAILTDIAGKPIRHIEFTEEVALVVRTRLNKYIFS